MVVVVAFIAILVAAGVRSAFPVLMLPLEQDFGWDRASIGIAAAVNLLMYGLTGPIAGRIVDRGGPRTLMLLSLVVLSVGTIGLLFMQALWQLHLLWGVVIGIGIGGTAGILSATVATRWFNKHKGLVVGILSSSHSAGQMVFIPVLMAVVVFGTWRNAILLLVVTLLALVLPMVFLLMRDDPSDVGVGVDGIEVAPMTVAERAADLKAQIAQIVPMRHVVRSPDFWLLALSFSICGGTSGGLIGTHLIPHSIDKGIPEVGAATAIGVMGLMNFVGTTGSGWLSDRVDKRKLLAVVFTFRSLSLLVLPFINDVVGLTVFAVLYGIDWLATAPPMVGIITERWGRRSVGSIMGWIFLSHQFGAATMAYLAGAIQVETGEYVIAFFSAAFLALIAAGFALRISRFQSPSLNLQPAAAAS